MDGGRVGEEVVLVVIGAEAAVVIIVLGMMVCGICVDGWLTAGTVVIVMGWGKNTIPS